MTDKQIEKIRLKIKKHKEFLAAERRKFGGYFDNSARRYTICELYMQIHDYKGAITYKRWFEKNFPDDGYSFVLFLFWAVSYFELKKYAEAEKYTLKSDAENDFLLRLLLDMEIDETNMDDYKLRYLEFVKSQIPGVKEMVTAGYLGWLSQFIDSEEYRKGLELIREEKLRKEAEWEKEDEEDEDEDEDLDDE